MCTHHPARVRPALPAAFVAALLAGLSWNPVHGADSSSQLATLMTGSEGEIRDAEEEDFVPRQRRAAGCRSYSSDAGAVRRFLNARLLTARPHAAVHLGPGKHFCITGFVVGRGLRLRIVGEADGWYRIRLGRVEGWVGAASVRREVR